MTLHHHPDVDALICGNDQIARGALDMLREAGRRVPHDVAVIGFDDWHPLTTGARPQLTSVDMRLKELGRRAAQALSEAIESPGGAGAGSRNSAAVSRLTLPARLAVRASTAPL
ncbi:substrate-binding domain-containing protein [Streptomyces sp. NPDC048430]|uniref:substrate-binding domain-containing protein n=1 Tax=Streptomyces sp. NPDC048430 TaxID=3155388 RepID=UPI0034259520